mgnify:CR=1 FL=1
MSLMASCWALGIFLNSANVSAVTLVWKMRSRNSSSSIWLIIPLSREVGPDEYMAVARKVAEEIGIEQFDDTTYEPSRSKAFSKRPQAGSVAWWL